MFTKYTADTVLLERVSQYNDISFLPEGRLAVDPPLFPHLPTTFYTA